MIYYSRKYYIQQVENDLSFRSLKQNTSNTNGLHVCLVNIR